MAALCGRLPVQLEAIDFRRREIVASFYRGGRKADQVHNSPKI